MLQRRYVVRRQADRDLLQRVKELENRVDRREGGHSDEAEHARRRTIRHNCRVAIEMEIGHSAGLSGQWSVDRVKIKGRVLDLSQGGASLFTAQSFELGQNLFLAIQLSDKSKITGKAAVRWVKAVPQKDGFASGVQFAGLSEYDTSKVVAFLKELDATAGL